MDFGPFSGDEGATARPLQRHLVRADGLFWAFYLDPSPGGIRYKTSVGAEAWVDRGLIISGLTNVLDGTRNLDVLYDEDRDRLHYAYAPPASGIGGLGTGVFRYRTGTPNADASITWLAPEQTVEVCECAQPHMALDSSGRVHVGRFRGETWRVSVNSATDGTWSTLYDADLSNGVVALKTDRKSYGSLHRLVDGSIVTVMGIEASKSGLAEAETLLAWSRVANPLTATSALAWSFPRHFVPVPDPLPDSEFLFSPTWNIPTGVRTITIPGPFGGAPDFQDEVVTLYTLSPGVGSPGPVRWLRWANEDDGWGCGDDAPLDGCRERVLLAAEDSYVVENDANANFGTDADLDLRTSNSTATGGAFERRVFIRWDLTPIPPGATVLLANWSYGQPLGVTGEKANVTAVNASWAEGTLTWNNQPGFDPLTETEFDVRPPPPAFGDRIEANVTDIVQSWVNGSRANHGLRVHSNSSVDTTWMFPSTEETFPGGASPDNQRPHLVVRYASPGFGFEDRLVDRPNATAKISSGLGGLVRWPTEDLSFTLVQVLAAPFRDELHFYKLRGFEWFGGDPPLKVVEQTPTRMEASTALPESHAGRHYTLYTTDNVRLDLMVVGSSLVTLVDQTFVTEFGPAWVVLFAVVGILAYVTYRFKVAWDRKGRNLRVRRGQWFKSPLFSPFRKMRRKKR